MITHSLHKKQLPPKKNGFVKTGVGNTRLDSQGGGLGEGTTPTATTKDDATKLQAEQLAEPAKAVDVIVIRPKLPEPARPSSIIRTDRIEVKPDWVNLIGNIKMSRLSEVFRILEEFTDEKLHMTGKSRSLGTKTFKYSGRSPNSLVVGWGDANENIEETKTARKKAIEKNRKAKAINEATTEVDEWLTTECLVSIPGKVLSAMSIQKIHDLCNILVLIGFHCSKLDIAVDDYGKSINPNNVANALEARNYTKFRDKHINWDFEKAFTFYMGSGESTRMTKFYNKEEESKGRVNSYRLETRFNSKIAHDVLQKWLLINQEDSDWEERSAKYLIKSVVGSINFVDRQPKPGKKKEKNLNRLKRLDWWQEFIDKLDIDGVICHSAPTHKTSLERATNWMKRSVMRRLVCVLATFKNDAKDWLMQALEEAQLSLKERHHVEIEQYLREYAQYKDEVNYGFARNYAVP